MPAIDFIELRKQQRRYYALLNGAQRGLKAPPLYPIWQQPSLVALGRKLSMSKRKHTHKPNEHINEEASPITITRGEEGTTWKVHVSQDAFGKRDGTEQGRFKVTKNKPSNSRDANSGLIHKFGKWSGRTLPRDLDSALSIHDKDSRRALITSGMTSSSRLQNVRQSLLCESRITSGRRCSSCGLSRASSKYGPSPLKDNFASLSKTPTFPSMEDVLQERVKMWPNKEPDYLRQTHHLPSLRAAKVFQPKIPQNLPFSIELTKPFVFSYYQKLNWQ